MKAVQGGSTDEPQGPPGARGGRYRREEEDKTAEGEMYKRFKNEACKETKKNNAENEMERL